MPPVLPCCSSARPILLLPFSPPQGLLASIATEVTRRLLEPAAADDFSRQHLANLVWALATLEYDPGESLRVECVPLRVGG